MKRFLFFLSFLLLSLSARGQSSSGPDSIFTFECICGYLSPQDTNCDICTVTLQSRFFKGVLIRRFGVPYKWIEQPYTIKFQGLNATFEELIPAPEKITIAMQATVFDTLPNYKAAIMCPCSGGREFVAGDGIYFIGDTINAVDPDTLNEAWTITDGTNFEVISDQIVTFAGASGATTSYNPATNTLTISASGGGGGDNWGSQVVQHDASLAGDGTSGNPLGINGYGAASNGELPSKSAGGITWITVDLSATNEIQTYGHSGTTSYTNTLSLGGGSFTLQSGGIVSIAHSAGTVTISATEVDGSVTNEAWTVDADDADTEVISNQTVKFQGGGITTTDYNPTTDVLLITSNEVDGSVTNEGILGVAAGSSTTSIITSNTVGANGVTLSVAGILTIGETTSTNGGTITLTATEVDGSVTNEIQTYGHSGTTSYTNTLSLGGGSFTLQSSGIVSIAHSAGTVTISATEVDGSITNEIQTLTAGDGAGDNKTLDLSLSGGTVTLDPAGILTISRSGNTLTLTATEVDGSTTNEVQTYGHSGTTSYTNTLSLGGGSFTLQASGIASISHSAGTVTISATEVDGSITNEGILGVAAGISTTSVITSNTSGANGVIISVAGILTIGETTSTNGGTITLTATEVDGSITNEAWTIDGDDADTEVISNQTVKFQGGGITTTDYNPTTDVLLITSTEVDGSTTNEVQTYGHSGTTSYTNTLSLGGGSFTLQASGIVSIAHSAGTVTISATEVDGSITNEGILGVAAGISTTSVITSNTSGANGVTISVAGILTIGETTSTNGGTITLTATEVDGSTSNEIQTYGHSGTTSYTNTLSLGGGSFTLQSGGIVSIAHSAGTVTISATEVDGSVTNEAWTVDADDADTEVISNQTVKFQGAGITTTDYDPTTNVLLITSTEVDGSTSNELQTYAHSGTSSYTNTLSAGGGSFTLQSSGIVTISNSSGTVTISATEVDGSTTNEGILGVAAGISTTSVITSNTSGANGVTISVAGILTIGETTNTNGGTITLTATEVDGSVTNEAWTIDGDDADTEVISNQTVKFQGAGIAVTDYNPATDVLLITATEVDGSTTNEVQTYGHSGTTSYTNTLSLGGGSFTLQASGIVSIAHSAGTVTISATEVDGSTTNEAWTIDGDDADTEVISNQTVKFQGAGITTTDYDPTTNVLLITATEVDGSVTNEIQTISASGGGPTSYNIDLSLSGGSITLTEGAGVDLTRSGNTITIAFSGDASITNEGLLGVSAGGANDALLTSNTAGATGVTYAGTNGIVITESVSSNGGTITIAMPAGSNTNTMRHNGTAWVASTEIQNNGAEVGIGGAPISGFELYVNGAQRNDGALVSRGTGSNFTANLASPHLRLWNTTVAPTTGDTWYLGSEDDGDFSLTSSNLGGIVLQAKATTGQVQVSSTLRIGSVTGTPTSIIGRNGTGDVGGLTLGPGISIVSGQLQFSGGGITAANNGLYVSGGTTVRLGTNPLLETTIIDHNGFEYRHSDGKISLTNQATSYTAQGADFGVEGTEALPTFNSTPTKDAIIELRASSSGGSAQPNSLAIGAYVTDADGIWLQARSHSVPNFEYDLSLQPRGGKMSVGRFGGLDALVTLAATGLTGSTVSGSVLHLEHSEGNGKTAMSMGAGTDILDSEIAWFDATDALRLTNRSSTNGTSTVRVAIGGETSDRSMWVLSATTPNVRYGVGQTLPANVTSTIHSAGSIATNFITFSSAVTLDEGQEWAAYTGTANVTVTLPTASTCSGRDYTIFHRGTAGTITLSASINKGNGTTFNTLTAGQFAVIKSDGSAWNGYKLTSL